MMIETPLHQPMRHRPRDVLLSELSFKINDRSRTSPSSYHSGACVMRADGSVKVLDESMTEDYVKQLLAQ